jgi:hypothetical protein
MVTNVFFMAVICVSMVMLVDVGLGWIENVPLWFGSSTDITAQAASTSGWLLQPVALS